ncbi:hypothetical protein F4811DRAFT_549925 [Daldinia bambusicola]|nr:hypothetical protein F4811DRAFT_549925 [Daldinia bambusicola]
MGYAYFCPIADSVEEALCEPWQKYTSKRTIHSAQPGPLGSDLNLSVETAISASASDALSGRSASERVETTVGEYITLVCPKDGHYGILIYAGVKRVKGHMKRMSSYDDRSSCLGGSSSPSTSTSTGGNYDGAMKDDDPYELVIPMTDGTGNGYYETAVCICKKKLGAWGLG